MLPDVDIDFENGNLGFEVAVPDGVFGLVGSAVAVADTFALDTPYRVTGMPDVAGLGILPSVDNYVFHKALSEFYMVAPQGTPLWIMGKAKTTKQSDWFAVDVLTGKAPAEKLLDAANGDISMLFTAFAPAADYVTVMSAGLDADVWLTLSLAQTFANNYTKLKFAPFYTLVDGYAFDGNKQTLKSMLTDGNSNRCQIVLGNTETRTGATAAKGSSVGLIAGRKASIQVHVSPGKKRDGAIYDQPMYIVDTPIEEYDVAALHDKGYVSFRKFPRKAGYYITDDRMACPATDDYSYGHNRRVIDKAFRIAYDTLVEYVLDDITVTNSGTIDATYAKGIEGAVCAAIFDQMTTEGELSYDPTNPKDLGVVCRVDITNNLASTSEIRLINLEVRSKAYGRYIKVPLGFVPVTSNN